MSQPLATIEICLVGAFMQPLHARSPLQVTDQEEEKLQQKLKWEKFVKEHELQQQRERNAERLVQKDADMIKYINRFGMVSSSQSLCVFVFVYAYVRGWVQVCLRECEYE